MPKPFLPRFRPVLCLLISAAVLFFAPTFRFQAAAEQHYVENEWNFVEESMDVSGGIPPEASGVLGRIARNGVLRVATVVSQTPRVFLDPERDPEDPYAGADIRLARCIADRMGVALKIVPLEDIQVLPSLTEDQCDLAIASLSYSPGRALVYTLSKSYYDSGRAEAVTLLIREADRDTINSPESLEGRVLVAQSNSLPEAIGALQIRNYLEFRRVFSLQEVFEAVAGGAADAGLVQARMADRYLKMYPGCGLCKAEGLPLVQERAFVGDRVAAKKGETELMYFVNGVIDELLAADAYDDWLEEATERAEDLEL